MTTPQLCNRHHIEPSPQTSNTKTLEAETVNHSSCGRSFPSFEMSPRPFSKLCFTLAAWCSFPLICCYSQRPLQKTYAWHVVRARTDIWPGRRVDWLVIDIPLCQALTHSFKINRLPFLLETPLDVSTLVTRVISQAPIGSGPSM